MINDRINVSIDEHVAHVQLARPEKMNSLDAAMFAALPMAVEQIAQDTSIRAVVLSGQGANFSAGLDKSNFVSVLEGKGLQLSDDESITHLAQRTHGITNRLQQVVWQWRELSIPVIAAIEGVAFGGGLQIALAADMRYVTEESQYSIMEIKWGLVPDMSGTQLMRHLAGDDRIRELSYTGRIFSATEAKDYGFVTEICDDPVQAALRVAHQIAGKNPTAIRAIKRLLNASYYQSAAEGLLMESTEQDQIIGSENQIEAVMAELEQRQPVFKDK